MLGVKVSHMRLQDACLMPTLPGHVYGGAVCGLPELCVGARRGFAEENAGCKAKFDQQKI